MSDRTQPEQKIYRSMSGEEFEAWLYNHGICHPDIHESIACDIVPSLIDDAINELPPAQPEERTEKRTETYACDSIGRQVAIDAVDAIGHIATMPDGDKCIRKSGIKYVLSMLPPAQPELSHTQKSCEYCHEDSDGYTRPIEKNCHAYIRFGMNGWELDLKAKGWHGEAQIKFCPMCGRELQGGR